MEDLKVTTSGMIENETQKMAMSCEKQSYWILALEIEQNHHSINN